MLEIEENSLTGVEHTVPVSEKDYNLLELFLELNELPKSSKMITNEDLRGNPKGNLTLTPFTIEYDMNIDWLIPEKSSFRVKIFVKTPIGSAMLIDGSFSKNNPRAGFNKMGFVAEVEFDVHKLKLHTKLGVFGKFWFKDLWTYDGLSNGFRVKRIVSE